MSDFIWKMVTCPKCGGAVHIHILSAAGRCACGAYYADTEKHRGWYASREAYEQGGDRIAE